MDEQLKYILALLRMPKMGPVTLTKWLDRYSNRLDAIFNSNPTKVLEPKHATPAVISYLQNPDWAGVKKDLDWASQDECHIITRSSPYYPALLRQISSAPPLLFYRGTLDALNKPAISVVGSRNASHNGLVTASSFASNLVRRGLCIVSGLALGVDSAAHAGALKSQGSTIAVLGTGIDMVYPSTNKKLAYDITENGGLISEFPCGTPPLAAHFPRRNRIVSGLALGVVVVEAKLKSGSLITAKLALDQGRDVFAVPGSIHSPHVKGCHELIKQGAKLVETSDDILQELGSMLQYVAESGIKSETSANMDISLGPKDGLDPKSVSLLNCVDYESTPIDVIVDRSNCLVQDVTQNLLTLELLGYISSVPGGYARKVVHA